MSRENHVSAANCGCLHSRWPNRPSASTWCEAGDRPRRAGRPSCAIMLRELPRSICCGPHDLLQAALRAGDLRHAAQQRRRVTALRTLPLNSGSSSVHSSFIALRYSPVRFARRSQGTPTAANSSASQPMPTPKSKRPPESLSRLATCFAKTTGLCVMRCKEGNRPGVVLCWRECAANTAR